MKLLSHTAQEHAHLVYMEDSHGNHRITKDRLGGITMSVNEALGSDLRTCVVNQRNKVTTVNLDLKVMLESQGFDVPSEIIV